MALGEGRSHQRGMSAANGHFGKMDLGTGQPLWRLGLHIARLDLDHRPKLLKNHEEKIDGPRANRAPAGEGNLGLAHPREKRRDDPKTRPHPGDELIGSRGIDDLTGAEMESPASARGSTRAPAIDRVIDAMMTENTQKHAYVCEIGNILEG